MGDKYHHPKFWSTIQWFLLELWCKILYHLLEISTLRGTLLTSWCTADFPAFHFHIISYPFLLFFLLVNLNCSFLHFCCKTKPKVLKTLPLIKKLIFYFRYQGLLSLTKFTDFRKFNCSNWQFQGIFLAFIFRFMYYF
jgi:hypothetical protein